MMNPSAINHHETGENKQYSTSLNENIKGKSACNEQASIIPENTARELPMRYPNRLIQKNLKMEQEQSRIP